MQQAQTINLETLPIGEHSLPYGKVWKFGSEQEAQAHIDSFQAPTLPDGTAEGRIFPFIFLAGGHAAVLYLFMLAYAQAYGGR